MDEERSLQLKEPLKEEKETKIEKFKRTLARVSPSMYVGVTALILLAAATTTFNILFVKQNQITQMQIERENKNLSLLDAKLEQTSLEIKDNIASKSKSLEDKITMNQEVVARLSKQVDDVSGMKSRIDTLSTQAVLDVMQHEIESGVVTDYFYVTKVTFAANKGRLESAVIDVDTQPLMRQSYSGYGNFTIDDRTLRARAKEIVDKVRNYYTNAKGDNPITWDNKTLAPLTIKNYSIGVYVNGSFLLKGEK